MPTAPRSAEEGRATRVLLATVLLSLLRWAAAAYEAATEVSASASDRRALVLAQGAITALALAALAARAALPRRPLVHRALVVAWIAALLAAQDRTASPQLAFLFLSEALLAALALCALCWPGRARVALYLATLGALGALLAGELLSTRALAGGAPDYGDLALGAGAPRFGPGGQLAPNLDLLVVGDGDGGRVRFVTEAHGFRRAEALAPRPAPGVFRALLVGDSFAAGYRVGQPESPGAVLERALAPAEVAAARLDDPVYAWDWLERHGLGFEPDLVVLLVTTANDAAGAWLHLNEGGEYEVGAHTGLARREEPSLLGFTTPPLSDTLLPASAFARRHPLARSLAAARAKLGRLRLLAPLAGSGAHTGAAAWYGDQPGRVHALDLMHGLGLYLARDVPPLVLEAEERLALALWGAHGAAKRRGVPLVVVPIPARIEVDARDWDATVARYALDPAAFDLERPRRELARRLARAGIPSLDLAPAFRAAAARGEQLFLPRGDMHWSARGATLAGETLADLLRGAGFAP
jgi:hypothetical protein